MSAVWQWPESRAGRLRPGVRSYDDWMAELPRGWWVQRDPDDGPIFCRFVRRPDAIERHITDWWQVILGPGDWSGVWNIQGSRRHLRVTVGRDDQPILHYRRGNCEPVDDWQAYLRPDLRTLLIETGLCTDREWERYTGVRAVRERWAPGARRMVWM